MQYAMLSVDATANLGRDSSRPAEIRMLVLCIMLQPMLFLPVLGASYIPSNFLRNVHNVRNIPNAVCRGSIGGKEFRR